MQHIEWRCPYRTYYQFEELLELLLSIPEHTDKAEAVIQQIRTLPGFPNDYDMDLDEIVVVPYKERL